MADFSALKTAIQTYIKQNGNEEITGEILQEILLSVVTTLGDGAINDLITALSNEVNARQQADGTLQQNITNEATARGNADTALSNRLGSTITAENTAAAQIGAEAEARAAADTALQGLINGVKNNVDNGYVYAGIATPATTPATGKVFYLALTAGTYTNFDNTEVSQGINILKYNGSAWSLDAFIGIDDTPTPNSPKLVKSGGTFESVMTNGSAFDISAHFASGGTLATYADLNAALTALNTLSASYKRGGMSIKFVRTSDNKYVQYRLLADTFTTDVTQWQGVDDEPTAGSDNLVMSNGVAKNLHSLSFSGKGDTVSYAADIVNIKGGNSYRFWIKEPAIDTHDVTTRLSNETRLGIKYTKADGTKVELIRVGCNTIPNPLEEYYDFDIPSDAVSVYAFGRCGTGHTFRIIIEDITIVNNTYEKCHPSDIKEENLEFIEAWTQDTQYYKGNFVTNDGSYFVANTEHVSGESFESAKWDNVDGAIYGMSKNEKLVSYESGSIYSNTIKIEGVFTNPTVIQNPQVGMIYLNPEQGNLRIITEILQSPLILHTKRFPWNPSCLYILDDKQYVYFDRVFQPVKDGIKVIDGLNSESTTNALSANQGKILNEKVVNINSELFIGEEKSKSEVLSDYEIVESGKVLFRVSDYIGQHVSHIPLADIETTSIVKIPISGYQTIKFQVYGSTQGNGSVIVDSNDVVLSAYTAPSSYITTIQPPVNAAYLYYSVGSNENYIFGYPLSKITDIYEKIDILNGRIAPEFRIQASNSCAVKPSLLQGKVSGNSVISNNKFVTTTAIFGNFYVELNDGYVIYQCSLVNRNGDIITDNYLSPIKHNGQDATVGRKSYGALQAVSELGFLVTICATDGSDISKDDCIIKKFSWINENLYTREIPNNAAAYWAAWKRSRIIQKAVFTPLSKLPARGSLNPNFYLSGNKYLGVPYSGARQYDKFVGVDVLIKTFLTALQNPRSLIYTENLRTGKHLSEYGFTYENDNEACTYYGIVCSAFTAFVLGIDIVYPSNLQASIPGMSKIDNFTAADIKPMDVIVTQGHVSIITDILKDKAGEVKYICWAEATSPLTKITPYTPTEFMARFEREKGDVQTYASGLYRYANLSRLTVENWDNLVEIEDDDYVRGIKYNEDICTFAGDYASFIEGQTIYINAKPGTIYTKMVVKREGGSSQTVDISSLTPDTNGYVDINITTLNLSDGIYEAELHSNDDNIVSEPTHFEILKADVSVTSSGTTRNVTFNYGHGNPYAVCVATKNGVIYYAKYLSSSEIENKVASFTYTDAAVNEKQIKLYVKGTYGIVASKANIS